MDRGWCNPENFTGAEAHYAHRSSFDWVMVGGVARWLCGDCRYEIEKQEEEMEDRVCMACNIVVPLADQFQEDRCEPCLETWRWNYMESRVF